MVIFTGDINLTDASFDVGYGVGSAIKRGLDPFHNIKKDKGSVWVGNFEGVTSTVSSFEGYRRNSFRIDPSLLRETKLIDYWNLANNHSMDHGVEAYNEMLKLLSNNYNGVFGDYNNKTTQINTNGKTVAVMGFSFRDDLQEIKPCYWSFPQLDQIRHEYFKIKEADYKVAYIHWGVEFVDHPNWEQQVIAHALIDMGFDLIIGMHPHVLQGYEVYNDKYIFYSIGNFVFNQEWVNTKYGAIVLLNPDTKGVSFKYIRIDSDYAPRIIDESEVPFNLRFTALNKKIGLRENPEPYAIIANDGLAKFRKYSRRAILLNLYRNDKRAVLGIFSDFIKRHIK